MVCKSCIDVSNLSGMPPSNCQLIIKGIKPQQQVNLCTGHCTNLAMIDTVDPQSTQPTNTEPVSVGPGEFSISYIAN